MQGSSSRLVIGNSKLAELIRSVPWDTHALGPIDRWPVALRAALNACLASRSPMQLWWGLEFVVFYNDAAIPFMGRHPDVLGRHAPELFGERWSAIREAVESARSEVTEVIVDELHLVPLLGDGGTVDGIVCSIDVEEADIEPTSPPPPADTRAHDDFLALIGHELRNPLSALSMTMQVFELREPSPELEVMTRSVRHLTRLVDDLLDISRITRGKLVLHRTPSELAPILDRALELVAVSSTTREVRVFVSVPRTGVRVHADLDRLIRTFAAVLTNSIEHSTPGSSVAVEASVTDDRVRIVIKDQGPGITADRVARVFEAFHTDHAPGSLGLGLSIARGVVELHGGTIALRSDGLGRGAECVIELALADPSELVVRPPAAPARKRVLLVEDNDDTARALQSALELLGYTVALAHDGAIALNLARAFEPDVVLLDIGLPVIDGWELARRLRVHAGGLQLIAVTARDQDSDKDTSAAEGFAEHLVKPIDLGRLQQLVDGLPARERS